MRSWRRRQPLGVLPAAILLVATACSAPAASPAPFPAAELPPDSLVRVLPETAIYRMEGPDGRVAPADPAIGVLTAGSEVLVKEGPREFGGDTWYVVMTTPDDLSTLAWLPVARPQSVELVEPSCPGADQGMLGLRAWDRVACYAGRSVTIEARVGHCQGGVVPVEPEWLGYACWFASDANGWIGLHADPASGIVFPNEIVRARMTGHFDDPAAATCRVLHEDVPAWQEPSQEEQVMLCRESFVVDSFEVLEVIEPSPAA